MRLLLDTHVFLWAATDLTKVSRAAASALARRSNSLFLSAVSVWEIAIKRSLGKLTLEIPLGQLLDLGRQRMGLETLAVTSAHALLIEHLPFHHRDPFDRLLVAQARAEEMTIVGADPAFDAYGVRRLW